VLEKAEKVCLVGNSLKVAPELHSSVSVAEPHILLKAV
jgi:hypothetical protein